MGNKKSSVPDEGACGHLFPFPLDSRVMNNATADWAPGAWVGKLCLGRIRCQPCHVCKVEERRDAIPAACLAAGLSFASHPCTWHLARIMFSSYGDKAAVESYR